MCVRVVVGAFTLPFLPRVLLLFFKPTCLGNCFKISSTTSFRGGCCRAYTVVCTEQGTTSNPLELQRIPSGDDKQENVTYVVGESVARSVLPYSIQVWTFRYDRLLILGPSVRLVMERTHTRIKQLRARLGEVPEASN